MLKKFLIKDSEQMLVLLLITLITIILLVVFFFCFGLREKGGYAPFFDICSAPGNKHPVVGMHLEPSIPGLNKNGYRFLNDGNKRFTFIVSSVIDTFEILEIVEDPFEYLINRFVDEFQGLEVEPPKNGTVDKKGIAKKLRVFKIKT